MLLTFQKWKEEVDRELIKKCGLCSSDLPDVDYYGLYDMGDSPAEAADFVIGNAQEN